MLLPLQPRPALRCPPRRRLEPPTRPSRSRRGGGEPGASLPSSRLRTTPRTAARELSRLTRVGEWRRAAPPSGRPPTGPLSSRQLCSGCDAPVSESSCLRVASVSCGGKTSLAKALQGDWHGAAAAVSVVHQDDYYWPPEHELWKMDGTDDWDVIGAIDVDRLVSDVLQLSSRLSTFQTKAPYVASYDGNSCFREQSAKTSLGSLIGARHHTVVVVEGNMLYNSPKLDSLFDFRLFFTLPYELCKARRLRRAYEPPEPEGYFDSVCWPRYTETLQAARTRDDVVMVDASPPLDAIRTEVEMRIEDLLVSAKRVGCLP